MKPIDVKKKWKSGTGVSDLDLSPVKVEIIDNQYEFESTSYIGGVIEEEDDNFTYKQEIDIRVNPGFFYIKDREFYCFNEKITQFSKAEIEDDIPFIELKELPNGTGTIPYINFLKGEYSYRGNEIFGNPPIIVKKYDNNELSDINCVFDQKISSRDGIKKDIGYRHDPLDEDIIISGETEDFPDFFSPLSRFAKCPEYWRDDHILNYDQYSYDYLTNRLILKEYDPAAEYSVEFENLNIPFRSGIELNCLKTIPSDYVLVIDPIETEDDEPARIKAFVYNRIVSHDPININIRVLNKDENGIPGKAVNITMVSSIIKKNGTPIFGIEREPFFFKERGPVYDTILCSDGDILNYNGINKTVSESRLISGRYTIPSCGCLIPGDVFIGDFRLYNSDPFPYNAYMNINTDSAGGVSIKYIPPAIIFEDHYVDINIESGSQYYKITLRLNGDNDICAKQNKTNFDQNIELISGEYLPDDGPFIISVPDSTPFPNDISFYEANSYLRALKQTLSQDRTNILNIYPENNILKITTPRLGLNYDNTKTKAIIIYDITDQTCITDGRSIYVE